MRKGITEVIADRCAFRGETVNREEVDRLRKRFMKLDKVRVALSSLRSRRASPPLLAQLRSLPPATKQRLRGREKEIVEESLAADPGIRITPGPSSATNSFPCRKCRRIRLPLGAPSLFFCASLTSVFTPHPLIFSPFTSLHRTSILWRSVLYRSVTLVSPPLLRAPTTC